MKLRMLWGLWRYALPAAVVLLGAVCLSGADEADAKESAAKEAAQSQNRDYSGMVRISDTPQRAEYLVVHDRKDKKGHAKYAWLGILTWTRGKGTAWKPMHLTIPKGERPPNDLEACCRVPGPGRRFLLAESGYYRPPGGPTKYGRVILISLREDPSTGWAVKWEKSFRPFAAGKDLRDKSRHIEGMACLSIGEGRLALFLCTMGTSSGPSALTWGALHLAAAKPFDKRGSARLTPGAGPLGERSCGDLYFKSASAGTRHYVWSSAAVDPGDAGPFRSEIFLAGELLRVRGPKLFRYRQRCPSQTLWRVDGIKVEAIARPPSGIPHAGLAIASDDEDLPGIWRVLPSRK